MGAECSLLLLLLLARVGVLEHSSSRRRRVSGLFSFPVDETVDSMHAMGVNNRTVCQDPILIKCPSHFNTLFFSPVCEYEIELQ